MAEPGVVTAQESATTLQDRLPTPPPPERTHEQQQLDVPTYRHIRDWNPPRSVAIERLVELMNEMWETWAWNTNLNPIWWAREELRSRPELIAWAVLVDNSCRRQPSHGYQFSQAHRQLRDEFTSQLARIEFARDDYDPNKPRRAA